MSQDFENISGRSRARQSRKKTSMRDMDERRIEREPAESRTVKKETRTAVKRATPSDAGRLHAGIGQKRPEEDNNVQREPVNRKGQGSQKRSVTPEMKRRRRIIKFIIAECFALLFIFGYAFFARRYSLIQRQDDFKAENVKNQELATETLEKMEGYWTIAVFGVDSRGTNTGKGANADVNMIFNINRATGEIKIVSVFRDTYLNIDDKGSYNKINQAYFLGGSTQAIKALNKNLDLDIEDYVTFNWTAVAEAINILGGIDMEISKAEFSYINGFITETQKVTGIPTTQLTHAGMNHLDGVQAVAYGRLRLMDTDFARTERQRKVFEAAFEKAQQADFSVLNNIIVTVAPMVSTSIDTMDMIEMAQNISNYHIGETGGFPFARGDANMGKKGACVIPQTLESNVVELHEFLFDDTSYTTTDQVKQISAKIASDSGMYTKGQSIDHVGTDGGMEYKPKTTAEETTKETEIETDEYGNIKETDEFGNVIDKDHEEQDEPLDGSQPSSGMESSESSNHGPGEETTEGETRPSQGTKPTDPSQSTRPTEFTRPTESSSAAAPTESSRAPIVSPTKPDETVVEPGGPGGNPTSPSPESSTASTGDGIIIAPPPGV